MKSYRANAGSGLEGLRLKEDPEPEPGPREVLVRVQANSLNFRELSILAGTYPLPVKPDVVMGADGAGEIVALGPDVSRVAIGDRIAAAMFPRWIDGPIEWEYAPQIGTATFPTNFACAFAKAARCCKQSILTAAVSPACLEVRTKERCS